MKSNQSQRKVNVLQSEDKKPPKKAQTQIKEQEITSEQEKIYLEGEPHIDPNTEDKEIMCPPIDVKDSQKMEKKQLKIFRPRENYLKEKITKLNYDEKLLNNIQKGLGEQVENIKSQIQEKNILITEVPKDLNKYIIKSASTENKIIKYSNEDYELKKKHKNIKELTEEQASLKKKLMKIEENENLLNNEGFMNLNNTYDGLTQFDKSIKEQQIKSIKNKKYEINERLIEIDKRLRLILNEEENNKLSKKEKLQSFCENFERDKEIVEARAKKYIKETKQRNQRLANDINQLVEKRKKEIEQKEKEEELKKDEIRKKFIEKEKAIEQKRFKENKDMMLKYKPFVNAKCDKNENNYLFGIYEKKYIENEKKLIKKVSNDRKRKNKTVTSDELENFLTKIEEKKEEIKKKKEIKNRKELAKFEMAKNFKPSYISHFNEIIEEENNKMREKEKNKKEEIEGLKDLKENYATNIRKTRQPTINEILKKERMDKIVALENPKLVQIKDTLLKRKKKKKIILIKREKKPGEVNGLDELNRSAIIQSHLIKRPKSLRFSSSHSALQQKEKEEEEKKQNGVQKKDNKLKQNKEQDKPNKKINYIDVIRKERLEKLEKAAEKAKTTEKDKDKNNTEINKWEKELNNKKGNIIQNIYNVKQQAEDLGKRAEMEEKLLKANGGIENNPELGKKITGYLIGSIEAKLSILNQMYKGEEKTEKKAKTVRKVKKAKKESVEKKENKENLENKNDLENKENVENKANAENIGIENNENKYNMGNIYNEDSYNEDKKDIII